VDYLVNQALTLSGDVYRQTNLSTEAERDMGEGRATWETGGYRLYSGFRMAEDRLGDGSANRSRILLGGAARSFYADRLQLRLDHEQLVGGGDNSSAYPTRTLAGADFRLTDTVSLFGEQELTWGSDEDTQSTPGRRQGDALERRPAGHIAGQGICRRIRTGVCQSGAQSDLADQ
jgi:hypothetical protein